MCALVDPGGVLPAHAPPTGSNSFVFAYVFTEKHPRQRLAPPNGSETPNGKSWIRHWCVHVSVCVCFVMIIFEVDGKCLGPSQCDFEVEVKCMYFRLVSNDRWVFENSRSFRGNATSVTYIRTAITPSTFNTTINFDHLAITHCRMS